MEPLTGFILYAVFALLVAAIAKKKGLRGWVYFLAIIILGPVVVMGTSIVTAGNASGALAATLAFLVPVVALVVVLLAKSGQQIAAETGQFGGYRKCPFCAEPVRIEAVKCKHCGSALEPAGSGPTSEQATYVEASQDGRGRSL
ncbi:hypothetical protein AQ725_03225 [Burkholderia pseudomallei]|uniref:zinc ribbon domain-containing protein n=1 Tax=Burkholderia pseudomallei TaxID=28450 RepID=UPI0005E28B02|nr:zinc ribbon domain-containing protein [Burkholderia pseudomallei]AYX05050.1 zinc ribbon domain-containing protein [Burkholderia pseudomallei]OMR49388.1 hypothetical protein AQ725_03225 [Burkholderia pseudomallei]CFT90279.1 phage-like membrane protein [Burkholderia pseudomallei]